MTNQDKPSGRIEANGLDQWFARSHLVEISLA